MSLEMFTTSDIAIAICRVPLQKIFSNDTIEIKENQR